jgi:chemotaxis signal transduction protein
MTRWLIVRAAGREIALPVAVVDEVVEIETPLPAPAVGATVRGLVPIRGRLVPVVHLASAVGIGELGPEVASLGVAVQATGRRLVMEVDEVIDLVVSADERLPRGWQGRWATTALRRGGDLVPVLDVEWIVERLLRGAEGTMATA